MSLQWKFNSKKCLKTYCKETTLPGWKYFIDETRSASELTYWLIVQVTCIAFAIYLFYLISGNYFSTPLISTLESSTYHISNIPFPGIAICDVNRISRKKAIEFAKLRAVTYNISLERMFKYVRYVGRLYDYEDENIEILNEFIALLDTSANNVQFDYFRFVNVMLELTPSLDENLLHCMWKGNAINCSHLFRTRRTMYGFCSTFNYGKSQDHVFRNVQQNTSIPTYENQFLDVPGIDMGLTLVVKSDVDDYFYPLIHMEGLQVLTYNPQNYPEISGGFLVESLIPMNREVFLQIEPITVRAIDELRHYTAEQRNCLFYDERTTAFDSRYYSNSDCLSECKMKSVLDLCGCIPFYMAISIKLEYSRQICTLSDVPCLNKYKEKWNTIRPAYAKGLEMETQNSIDCSYCLPDCSFTKYGVLNEYTPLIHQSHLFNTSISSENISLIHIYFDRESTFLYKTDVLFTWYDIISNFGGMCGLFIGLSLISIIELFYILLSNLKFSISK